MTVSKLIEELLKLEEQGYGDYRVEDGDTNASPQLYVSNFKEVVYI